MIDDLEGAATEPKSPTGWNDPREALWKWSVDAGLRLDKAGIQQFWFPDAGSLNPD